MRTCDDRRLLLTPSLPQPVRFPGSKVHTYTLANSMFDGPITNLLSILSISIEVLPGTHAAGGGGGGGGSLNDFKFGTSSGRFPSDGARNMAVKGLNLVMR